MGRISGLSLQEAMGKEELNDACHQSVTQCTDIYYSAILLLMYPRHLEQCLVQNRHLTHIH